MDIMQIIYHTLPTRTDNWVNTTGDTMTGSLTFSGVSSDITTVNNEHLSLMPNGTGKVGIGTTSPIAALQIDAPNGVQVYLSMVEQQIM